ncbi:MAG: hypothetical protein EOP38_07365 [Rubrivivax sp.]|nr:MAG: hypothetical protein EOP38_07365 [Rubrivivax sp.]
MDTTSAKPDDASSTDASTIVDRAAQSAHEAIDRVAAKAGPAVEQLHSAANSAADALRAKADALGDLEDQWIDTARDYVRTNPLTAVAAGVLLGVLISRLAR